MSTLQSIKQVVLWNRIIRFVLGGFFIGTGIYYWQQGGWPATLFGAVFVATGIFRPRRCVGEAGCADHSSPHS